MLNARYVVKKNKYSFIMLFKLTGVKDKKENYTFQKAGDFVCVPSKKKLYPELFDLFYTDRLFNKHDIFSFKS